MISSLMHKNTKTIDKIHFQIKSKIVAFIFYMRQILALTKESYARHSKKVLIYTFIIFQQSYDLWNKFTGLSARVEYQADAINGLTPGHAYEMLR